MCECNGHRAAIVIPLLLLDSFSYDSEHWTLNEMVYHSHPKNQWNNFKINNNNHDNKIVIIIIIIINKLFIILSSSPIFSRSAMSHSEIRSFALHPSDDAEIC